MRQALEAPCGKRSKCFHASPSIGQLPPVLFSPGGGSKALYSLIHPMDRRRAIENRTARSFTWQASC